VFLHTEAPVSYFVIFTGSGVVVYDSDAMDGQKSGIETLIEKMTKSRDYLSLFWISKEPQTVFTFEADKEKMTSGLNSIDYSDSGSPSFYDTINKVNQIMLGEVKEKNYKDTARKVMIVISDGRDEGSKIITTDTKLFEKIKVDYPIYTIGISPIDGAYLGNLKTLSNNTGGNYMFGEPYRLIPGVVENFVDQVMNSYVLKFNVKGIKGDEKDHVLKIGVEYGGETQYSYKPFFANKRRVNIWIIIIVILIVLIVVAAIVLLILIVRKKNRIFMGITGRKCPVCKRRMKDDWDECIFCKYLPAKAVKSKNLEE